MCSNGQNTDVHVCVHVYMYECMSGGGGPAQCISHIAHIYVIMYLYVYLYIYISPNKYTYVCDMCIAVNRCMYLYSNFSHLYIHDSCYMIHTQSACTHMRIDKHACGLMYNIK